MEIIKIMSQKMFVYYALTVIVKHLLLGAKTKVKVDPILETDFIKTKIKYYFNFQTKT